MIKHCCIIMTKGLTTLGSKMIMAVIGYPHFCYNNGDNDGQNVISYRIIDVIEHLNVSRVEACYRCSLLLFDL